MARGRVVASRIQHTLNSSENQLNFENPGWAPYRTELLRREPGRHILRFIPSPRSKSIWKNPKWKPTETMLRSIPSPCQREKTHDKEISLLILLQLAL
jgi:hypothetical protein